MYHHFISSTKLSYICYKSKVVTFNLIFFWRENVTSVLSTSHKNQNEKKNFLDKSIYD